MSKRGQVTIPKRLRDQFDPKRGAGVEMTPTDQGLLIRKQPAARGPMDRVCGILDGTCDVDEYLEEIRGR